MKTPFFATLLTAALLTTASAFAAPLNDQAQNGPNFEQQRPGDRDPRSHRVTPQERARWEAEQRHDDRRADNHFDRSQNYGFDRDHQATRDERRHWEASHNYGYAQNHRVTPQEQARWEDQYRH